MRLSSPDFAHEASMPKRLTCQGADVSPALEWSAAPEGTRSYVLCVVDPDAPDPRAPLRPWIHWVLYNLPRDTRHLPGGVETLPEGTREGLNDWKRTGYGGPCPPVGRHRYFHTLYALDGLLPDLHVPTWARLEKAMAGHVLAKAELVGTYQKE